jgi:hypothetical protein
MRKIGLVATLGIIFSGCVGSMIENGLNALQGRDVRAAFNVLGYPSGKQDFGSEIVYFWSYSDSGTQFVPQTSTTSGLIGNVPVYGTTTYNQAVPYNYNCLIRLITDKSDRIIMWDYKGNLAGCSHYAGRLNAYYKNQNFTANYAPLKRLEQAEQNSATNYSDTPDRGCEDERERIKYPVLCKYYTP